MCVIYANTSKRGLKNKALRELWVLHHWFFYTIDFSAAILYISYHLSPKWKRNIPLTVYEVFQLFTAIQKSN